MITHAKIHFNDCGTPVADDFDDVYFSNEDGLAESDYVFYQHNHISERLRSHPREQFVIAETGFGTGLNFLNAWQRFATQTEKKATRLHFISFEKFPIQRQDLAGALAAWPQLSHYSEQLVAQYPEALPGCHRLHFGEVTLDLWIGDVLDSIEQMNFNQHGLVDAWFLDGFAPSKNPDMWQQSLFDAMAHLGREAATFATFTAAGFVRRGLQQAGFKVNKVKGYGRKREMIVGELEHTTATTNVPAPFVRHTRPLDKVAIVGGGIAAATLAHRLTARNIPCTLFCADDELAQGASHNKQGAVYPHLQADVSPSSELFAHSFYMPSACTSNWQTMLILPTNGVACCYKALKRKDKNAMPTCSKNNWPQWLIQGVDAKQASDIAGIDTPYGGLFIPDAGWVSPVELVQALVTHAKQRAQLDIHFATQVTAVNRVGERWQLLCKNQGYDGFSDVFICMGSTPLSCYQRMS